jgi:two-component system OmpR family response regulator
LSATVLIVDDDAHIREVVRYALEQAGMTVHEACHGLEGLDKARQLSPSLIVLDILMPEMDGLSVCRELRKTSQIPILFLSSRDEEIDRILGLEMGGDDYLSKPFSPRELVARAKAILKRLIPPTIGEDSFLPRNQDTLHHGDLSLCPTTYQAHWRSQPFTLTVTEFHLLQLFLLSPHKVFTRDELVQATVFKDIVSDRTIDSHIRRLRQKCSAAGCETAIETVHGFGYKLGLCQ